MPPRKVVAPKKVTARGQKGQVRPAPVRQPPASITGFKVKTLTKAAQKKLDKDVDAYNASLTPEQRELQRAEVLSHMRVRKHGLGPQEEEKVPGDHQRQDRQRIQDLACVARAQEKLINDMDVNIDMQDEEILCLEERAKAHERKFEFAQGRATVNNLAALNRIELLEGRLLAMERKERTTAAQLERVKGQFKRVK
jgi:hypothetical protein